LLLFLIVIKLEVINPTKTIITNKDGNSGIVGDGKGLSVGLTIGLGVGV
jgi:hypothetical protein